MHFDRFDIVEAHYLALTHCHGGQDSPEYARLCHIQTYFKPPMDLGFETLTENGQTIYECACTKYLNR